jgi:hypothetical protein
LSSAMFFSLDAEMRPIPAPKCVGILRFEEYAADASDFFHGRIAPNSSITVSAQPARRDPGYFFINSSTAVVIAFIPVRKVGSGNGSNRLE